MKKNIGEVTDVTSPFFVIISIIALFFIVEKCISLQLPQHLHEV